MVSTHGVAGSNPAGGTLTKRTRKEIYENYNVQYATLVHMHPEWQVAQTRWIQKIYRPPIQRSPKHRPVGTFKM